jgi:peptidoglycan/xylan/chitin deacetylase (PgdA/CDA1 family)
MNNLIPVFAYHSQNIANNDYFGNDHVAFQEDVAFLVENKFHFLSALELVLALRAGTFHTLPKKSVVITFDDGPVYDAKDFIHPLYGYQKSMSNIMQEVPGRGFLFWKKRISATSFVIASDLARSEIGSNGPNDNYLSNDFWSDRRNLLQIAVHGWDHVHPLSTEANNYPESLERFDRISDLGYADLQVKRAAEKIKKISGVKYSPVFAYPYGMYSDFFVEHYFPRQSEVLGAFTVDGKYCDDQTNVWKIPRFVCGFHWKSKREFESIISN